MCRTIATRIPTMTKPSDAELRLLQQIWGAGRLSAREIHDAIGGDATWSYSSTRKTLDRMEEKGLVAVKAVHGIKTYAAAEPKLVTLAGLIRDFARNVLGADGPLPAATFVNARMIDPEEVAELEALLERLSKDDRTGDEA
jgi:predicted transcriptional regulator